VGICGKMGSCFLFLFVFVKRLMTDFDVFVRWQIFNVFLVTTLSGTIFKSINDIINSPISIFSLLGENLPKVHFFL
jgi:hypothetical protein